MQVDALACDKTNSTLAFPSSGGITPVQYVDCAPATEANDDIKVQSIINEIDGKRSDGSTGTGKAPAIFGMNFQAVSVGQKLVVGGYDAGLGPRPILKHAIAHTDASPSPAWRATGLQSTRRRCHPGQSLTPASLRPLHSPRSSMIPPCRDQSPRLERLTFSFSPIME